MKTEPGQRRPEGSARDREIVAARVIVTCPGRNFVTLRIETRSGVFGLGDATLNGRELAVAAYVQEHIVPCLIGRDAGRIEDAWQFFYRGAYWRRGPVTMTARGGRPLYRDGLPRGAGAVRRSRPQEDVRHFERRQPL
jgi:mannonate dehydratase